MAFPIITPLKQALSVNRIQAVMGIINGTTNYILTRMQTEGGDFESILADAQALGYAEADPTADVDGLDAADKIAILAALAFGGRIDREKIYCEGIRNISAADITYAENLGFVIKLLAIAKLPNEDNTHRIQARVHPTLVPIDHPLANVNDVNNAVLVEGDPIGQVMFYGPGAGEGPTASAVVSDLLSIAATLANGQKFNPLLACSHRHRLDIVPNDEVVTRLYVRLLVKDTPGVIGKLGTCFGNHSVSLESIVQIGVQNGLVELVVVTHEVQEGAFQKALAEIRQFSEVQDIPSLLHVLVNDKALHRWRRSLPVEKLGNTCSRQESNVDASEIDWLLQGLTALTGLSLRLENYRDREIISSKVSITTLTEKWHQRINSRVPVQYLVGETPWRNFSLTVTPDVLIPRPETELIIDIIKKMVEQSPTGDELAKGHWADLGTGSGAIALALAHQFLQATIHAVDISEKALAIAQLNAQQNNLTHRIQFHQGSWLAPLSHLKSQLSAIISNPPYIPTQTVLTLQPEVKKHEPHLALDGGTDGLNSIRQLITQGALYLQPNGLWLIELMSGQAQTVETLLKARDSYTNIQIHQDLSGIQRFVSACKAL